MFGFVFTALRINSYFAIRTMGGRILLFLTDWTGWWCAHGTLVDPVDCFPVGFQRQLWPTTRHSVHVPVLWTGRHEDTAMQAVLHHDHADQPDGGGGGDLCRRGLLHIEG